MSCYFMCAPVCLRTFTIIPQCFCAFLRLSYNAVQLLLLSVAVLPSYGKAVVYFKGFLFTFGTALCTAKHHWRVSSWYSCSCPARHTTVLKCILLRSHGATCRPYLSKWGYSMGCSSEIIRLLSQFLLIKWICSSLLRIFTPGHPGTAHFHITRVPRKLTWYTIIWCSVWVTGRWSQLIYVSFPCIYLWWSISEPYVTSNPHSGNYICYFRQPW